VPEDQRLNLVVYVDQQNITPINRNKLFRYLRQFLNTKLDRDDRVMLVTYNRSLKVGDRSPPIPSSSPTPPTSSEAHRRSPT
jgi:hypothetical protein